MPIRVECNCGHAMNVPDALAGKAGKCPKCQQIVRIPAAEAGQPGAAKPAAAQSRSTAASSGKAAGGKPAAKGGKPAAAGGPDLSELLNEAGVQQREGRRCPECDAPLAAQAVFCTNCGFNLEAGEKVEAATLSKKRARFRNPVLNEAVENMARDTTVDKRLKAAGMPWWVVLCLLLGGVILAGAGILIVDARSNEMQPAGTTFGELQRLPVGLFLLYVVMTISGMIAVFAFLALTVSAFYESLKEGLLVLLVPLYVLFYCITRFKRYRGTAVSFMGAIVAFIASWVVAATQY